MIPAYQSFEEDCGMLGSLMIAFVLAQVLCLFTYV